MSRVVLKERQFEPTGNNLGSFEAKDLETFDLQYTDTDEKDQQSSSGNQPSSHVPQPKDDNPLEKDSSTSNQDRSQGGGSSDSSQDDSSGEDNGDDEEESNIPDEWDPYGENLDDQDPDLPDPSDNSQDSNGGYGGDSSGEDDEEETLGGNSQVQNSLDQTGSSQGSEEEDSSDSDSENSSNDASDENPSSGSGDSSGSSDSEKDSSTSNQDRSQGGGSSDSSQDDSSGEDNGDDEEESNTSMNGSPSGNTSSSSGKNSPRNPDSDYGTNNSTDYSDMKSEPTDEELEAEDQDFDQGTLSDLEKALQKIKETSTESSKSRQQSTNERAKEESGDSDDMRNNKNRQDEISAAKDILGKALQDTKENESSSSAVKKDDDDDDYDRNDRNSESAEDILSSLGAGNLTTLFNPSTLSDWRARLTKLFDKALGFDIVTNPNLVNKKIEDAPPGREDEIPVIKNVVILLDLSSSMGSTEFKQVISHVDTMLRARKMNNTWFHIVAFGDSNIKTIEPYYTKCKGSQFKKKIMSSPYLEGIWMTDLVPGIILAATKVHQPDAVIIMTDAGFNGGGKQALERNSKAKTFMKKNKTKIIWALTTNFSKRGVEEFDPTALSQKRYVKFKNTK